MAKSRLAFGQRGAIVTIRLRNFMTYSDCTLKPAGNLNMIIGPNGSGKSAIVCAIIVGLAGEVSLTGRATNIVSLVRKGSDWASTMIELWSGEEGEGNYTIERKISITSRAEGRVEQKSEWILNGHSATMREIKSLTKELNIKVDNLCQFLPQDSVASFVKMSHSELLVNTLKAAGDNKLVDDLTKLVDFTRDITEQTQNLDQLEKSSRENEINARRLETEVERLRERETLAEEKKICSKKVLFVRYQEACKKLWDAKDAIKTKEAELRLAESSGDPYKHDIEVNKTEESRLLDYITKCEDDKRKANQGITKLLNKISELKIKCQEAYAAFKAKEDEENTRASKLQLKKQELEGYECRYNELRTTDHSQEIDKLQASTEAIKEKMFSMESDKRKLNERRVAQVCRIESAQRERDEIMRIKDRKLNLVKARRNDLYRVIEWLTRHKDKFREQVFLPMLCEINVIETTDAAVVEHAIPESDRWAFVCQNEHDLKYLTKAAREEVKANINVILTPERTTEEFMKELDDQQDFPRQNFRAYMKDLIDAPQPIMRVLYGLYNFHLLPVFNQETTEAELKILMTTLKRFYVRDSFYQISKSRYDGETMTATDTVRAAHDLIYSLDTKRLDEKSRILASLHKEKTILEEEFEKTLSTLEELGVEWNGLVKRLGELRNQQSEKKRVENSIKIARRSIEDLQTTKIDIEEERLKLQDTISEINRSMVVDLQKLSSVTQLFCESLERVSLSDLLRNLAKKNHLLAKKKYEQAMVDAKRLREEIDKLRPHIERIKSEVSRAKEAAEEKISGFSDGKLDKQTKRIFSSIEQETAEALEIRIEELKARIQGIIRDPNNSIMSDYNRQTEELRNKRAQIAALKRSIEEMNESREEIKTTFVPSLNNVIKDIDDHYREFMQKLNYDGKVELEYDETKPNDFSEYGIRILVKYRDEERLIALSSTRQSGGERSVATMIYMLALQTQTTVPFRVVDEINQGMDRDNERKVFELLVRTADESSSQYFLVSPKLLSNLEYGENMQIHVVFNGPKLEYSFNDMMAGGSLDSSQNQSGDESELDE